MLRSALLSAATIAALSATASAANFVTSVGSYTEGDVFIASGVEYTDATTALNAPGSIVGPSTAFAGILSPFNPHYENDQIVAIGRGGSITLGFAQPIPVGAGREIGVYTTASFFDVSFPDGGFADPARTAAYLEYGAERTAIVEVADSTGSFVSLGRVIFDDPTNYYANATNPFQFPAPVNPIVADFSKPYLGEKDIDGNELFSGGSYSDLLTLLDGAAGGTWIDVPTDIGLLSVTSIRLSDPMWRLDDGTLLETRTSGFEGYVKPADLFIDAVAAVPEPSSAFMLAGVALLSLRRRR